MFRDPPQLCSPVDNRCDTFLRASRSCGSACTNARLSDSRIGVHGLSQVLSTVLMFFVRYSVQLICWHVYLQEFNHSPFPSCTAVALSVSTRAKSYNLNGSSNPLHCRKYSPDWTTLGFCKGEGDACCSEVRSWEYGWERRSESVHVITPQMLLSKQLSTAGREFASGEVLGSGCVYCKCLHVWVLVPIPSQEPTHFCGRGEFRLRVQGFS